MSGNPIDGITVTPEGTFRESYPVVTKCPACESTHGYQSFDIWICGSCGEWSSIEPTESEEIHGD